MEKPIINDTTVGEIYAHYAKKIMNEADCDYIYTINEWMEEDVLAQEGAAKLPFDSRGMNEFMDHRGVIIMGSYRYNNVFKKNLRNLSTEFERAYFEQREYMKMLQDVGRSAVRKGEDDVVVIVPSKGHANYLHRFYPNSEVIRFERETITQANEVYKEQFKEKKEAGKKTGL